MKIKISQRLIRSNLLIVGLPATELVHYPNFESAGQVKEVGLFKWIEQRILIGQARWANFTQQRRIRRLVNFRVTVEATEQLNYEIEEENIGRRIAIFDCLFELENWELGYLKGMLKRG